MRNGLADLHTHTICSDGMNAPAHNVRLAKEAGLAAVAITDHDTVAGVAEAIEEGRRIGVEVVPGVEISATWEGRDIHILGYFIHIEDAELTRRLEKLRSARSRRNVLVVEKLQASGIPITMEDVYRASGKNEEEADTVGRPHIAQVLMNKGYASNMQDAFDRYLARGAQAYAHVERVAPEEAIDWIRQAGGAAVLAHPGLYQNDEIVKQLIAYGLDGIEAYHSDHTPEQERHYANLAVKQGLLITAGSDYHGERAGQVFHAPIGTRTVDIATIDRLRQVRDRE